MSIASKVDADSMDALMKAQLIYDGSASAISYSGIVDAVDKFNEELNTEKAMFLIRTHSLERTRTSFQQISMTAM